MSFEVDPAVLRQADERIGAAIADAEATLAQFEAAVAAFGEPWGADDLGSLIGEIYLAAYAMAMNCYNSNLDTMDGYATRLAVAADRYEESDIQSADRVHRAGAGSESPDIPA
jgi:hypothetical protein